MNAPAAKELTQSGVGQRFVPRDRESFFAAQAHNRRATWRMSILCGIGAALMGIPLALVITPLLYGVAMIVADVVNLFSPLPREFWQQAGQIAHLGLHALQWLLQPSSAAPPGLLAGAAVMLLPGVLFSLALWLAVNRMFHHSGIGGALLALKAREPNQAQLKELQLADVVQEMAIAAGLPAPALMLIDSPAANAAVFGTSPHDARIVVSCGLIDTLGRDELEAVLAHLIASIGNGDLRIALRMTSVLEACGLLVAVINAPFGRQSRQTLWRMVRYWFSAKKQGLQEAAEVADILMRSASLDTDDIDRFFDPAKRSRLRSIRSFLFFPIFFTNAAVKLLLWFFSWAILGPSLALLWRTRQYLADAAAVQLTRDPDSLARALQKLNEEPANIAGGDWASHLFLVSPRRADRSDSNAIGVRQRQMLAHAWAASTPDAGQKQGSDISASFPDVSRQFSTTLQAALAGDAKSIARLRSVYQSVAAADPALAAQFPNPDDLLAARQGDFAAVARLQAARRKPAGHTAQSDRGNSSSDPMGSFLDFHPPLKRRLKRLSRMGAHVNLGARDSKTALVILVLSLLLGPFALLAIALLLLLIVIMILASLAFTVIWLAIIHQVFTLFGSPGS